MERKRRHSDQRSLAVALIGSLVLHAVPFVSALRIPFARPVDLVIRTRTVDFGLEQHTPGARTLPTAQPAQPTQPPQPAQPPQPPPARRVERPTPRNNAANELLPVPDLRLRVPNIAPRPTRQLDPNARPATPRVTTPSVATTASDLAPMVPQGSLLTIAIRTDRIRATPHARPVRRLLNSIRDWREMLGGASLDIIDDLDRVVLAAANPFGQHGQPPDWNVLAKAAGHSDRRLRAAVEAMAESDRPLAPSPVNPPRERYGDADGGATHENNTTANSLTDGGVRDAGQRRDIWTQRDGARVTTLERYGAQRSYVLLPDGTAAIALSSQIEPMLAALARRPPSIADDPSSGVAVVVEAEGLRNVVTEVPTMHGPFPIPRRLVLTIEPEGERSAGAELVLRMDYDSASQARSARDEWEYARSRWGPMLDAIPGVTALRIGAGLFGRRSVVDHIHDAITALSFRSTGSAVVGRVHVTEEQLRSILDTAPMVLSGTR